jgi:hypothetical protein
MKQLESQNNQIVSLTKENEQLKMKMQKKKRNKISKG